MFYFHAILTVIIITYDFNTSFSRNNTQSKCLQDFIDINNLFLSWEHPSAKGGNNYINLSLGHLSIIDHFGLVWFVDCILINRIVDMYIGIDPSHHVIILLSFQFIINVRISTYQKGYIINTNYLWNKTSTEDITNYNHVLNQLLSTIAIDCDVFTYSNCICLLDTHKPGNVDKLCNYINQLCISASEKCFPMASTGARMEGSGLIWTKTVTLPAFDVARGR